MMKTILIIGLGRFGQHIAKKLNDMNNLKVIGITGSYGKTSSKNILNDIVNEEMIHVGQLQKVLELINPDFDNIEEVNMDKIKADTEYIKKYKNVCMRAMLGCVRILAVLLQE